MADKPRVKAPKKRAPARTEEGADRSRLILAGVGALVTIAVVAVGAIFLVGAGGGTSADDARVALESAGCTLQEVEALEGTHTLGPDDTSDRWNTDPPTSGPHFGFNANGTVGTVIWGAYEEPVQLARIVHNLEHGGVFILYGDDVADDEVTRLRDFYGRHENGTLVAPYAKLGDQVALGAWVVDGSEAKGYLAKCPGFDEDAYSAFLSAFQFKGPEPFAEGDLLPGTN